MPNFTQQELDNVVEQLLVHTQDRDHMSSFNRTRSGPDLNIQSVDDLRRHIMDTLNDPNTRGVVSSDNGRKIYLYNDATNTFITLDFDNPANSTSMRPKTPGQGQRFFERQPELAVERHGLAQAPVIDRGGLSGVVSAWETRFPGRVVAPGVTPPPPTTRSSGITADMVLADTGQGGTVGFWEDADANTRHYFSERYQAVVTVTGDQPPRVQLFETLDDAQNAYGQLMKDAAGRFPNVHGRGVPDIFTGGAAGLDEAARSFRSGGAVRRLANFAGESLEFLGKAAKILGPLGVVGAMVEVSSLENKAQQLANFNLVPGDALIEYGALLAEHIAQATADPTMVGGEILTQTWFEDWANRNHISDEVRQELQPGSLLRDLQAGVEAANAGLRTLADAALEQALVAASPLAREAIAAQIARHQPLRDLNPRLYDQIMDQLGDRVLNSDNPNALRDLMRDNSGLLSRRMSADDLGALNRSLGLSIPSISRPRLPRMEMPSAPDVTPNSGGWFNFRFPNFEFRLPSFELPTINPFRLFKLGDASAGAGESNIQLASAFGGAASDQDQSLQQKNVFLAAYDGLSTDPARMQDMDPSIQNLASLKTNIEGYKVQYYEQLAHADTDPAALERASNLFDRMAGDMDLFEQEYQHAVDDFGAEYVVQAMGGEQPVTPITSPDETPVLAGNVVGQPTQTVMRVGG